MRRAKPKLPLFPSLTHPPLLLIFIGFLLGVFSGCSARGAWVTRSRLMMGHVPVTLRVLTAKKDKATTLQVTEEAYQLAQDLEDKLSEYQAGSEISCLNRQAGQGFCELSPETHYVLKQAVALSEKTQGAFDIRFNSPTPSGRIGKIIINEKRREAMLENPQTRIGLGAIAKGYIVDRMVQFLNQRGYDEAQVQAGGDLRVLGGPYPAGIQTPQETPGQYSHPLKIKNEALATSGTYEQGNHILDPKTHRPVPRVKSVTVRAQELLLADALSTAFFVLGEQNFQPLLPLFPGIQVYWTDPEGLTRVYAPPTR